MKVVEESKRYIRGIDGLRALAVLAVMLFHLDPLLLPGGFSGVDVFFVISGYVVSSSLAQDSHSNLFHFTIGFYARRIIRIFPALIVCLLIVSIVTTLFFPVSWLSSTSSKTGLFAFFGLSNYALIWFNDGYFSPRVEFNSFAHTWSLGVEEQFYLFFPLIMFVWIKYKARENFIGFLAKWLLTFLIILSLLYSYIETFENPDEAFYLLPSRFWELASGALLYKLHSQQKMLGNSAKKQHAYSLLGTILVGLGFIFSDKQSFPFPWAILSVSGTVFLISALVGGSQDKFLLKNILESKWLVQVGKTSFSLYLWHWPAYVFFRWTLGLETIFEITLAVLCTFILANISYYFIEKPIRKNKKIINRQNWQIISIGIATIVISFMVSNVIFKAQSTISLSVTKNKEIWDNTYIPFNQVNSKNKVLSERKIFVLGDSHAGAYSPMLHKLSNEYGINLIKLSSPGCEVANFMTPGMSKSEKCTAQTENAIAYIELSASPGDILFLASLRMPRFGDQWALWTDEKSLIDFQGSELAVSDRKEALKEVQELLRRLEVLKIKIVIDAPKPIFKSPPFRCSDWFNSSNPICAYGLTMPRDTLLDLRKPVMESLGKLSYDFPQLIIWDPFPILCNTNICSSFKNNAPLFFDADHLSRYGNEILYPSFKSLVKGIWQLD